MTSLRSSEELSLTAPSASPVYPAEGGSTGLLVLYSLTIFLSAFLLFQVQPLIAKFILPWFGGTSGVWTTCMLFFQLLLFGGYLYAHLTTTRLSPRVQATLHIALLIAACLTLPVIPRDSLKPTGTEEPISWIVFVLGATVGVPFFLLSSTGPLLQGWFGRTHQNRSPYRLYALSNVGSLLALITFPAVFEWLLPTRILATIWSVSFGVFALLCTACAWIAAIRAPVVSIAASRMAEESASRLSIGRVALWFALAMVPSVLLLATTNQVCMDVASAPFLWVAPLTLYLLSFILCFDSDRWYSRRWFMPASVLAFSSVCYVLANSVSAALSIQVGAYFATLFICAMICHGELVRLKPHVQHLTAFYLVISAGGAAGGLFVGIVAPLCFNNYFELHVGVFACALLILVVLFLDRQQLPIRGWWALVWLAMLAGVSTLGTVLVILATRHGGAPLAVSRNFYGVLRVQLVKYDYEGASEPQRELMNGHILHGDQYVKPTLHSVATTYYDPASGVGRILTLPFPGPRKVGLIGLGIGTLATYARAGDHYRFYEINAKVPELARKWFWYLPECKGEVEIAPGDARLSLSRESRQNFNVLVVDAFSGDAIPVHLLTHEAFEIYLKHMAPEGVIAVHISNKYFELEPVVRALADDFKLTAVTISAPTSRRGATDSMWVLVSKSPKALKAKSIQSAAAKPSELRVDWTDDHASLFDVWLAGLDRWFRLGKPNFHPSPSPQ